MKISDNKLFGILLIIFGLYTLYKGDMNFYFGLIMNFGVYNYIMVFVIISFGFFLLLREES